MAHEAWEDWSPVSVGAAAGAPSPRLGPPAGQVLRFPGCRPIPLRRDRLEDYEGRIEYWEARTETAWIVAEPPGAVHEGTSRRLPHLVERIAMVRGARIESFGSVGLLVRDAQGKPERMMEADETVYLHPHRSSLPTGFLTIGEHDLPDVVLEVDHTTDVRPGKLILYEAWGFPELWVVVPPAGATRRKPAGLTIHRMLGGRYQPLPASVAFPGWTAEEIHAGLTKPVTAQTYDVLARVGRALGEREGTGPDDDPMLRAVGEQKHVAGLAEGRAAGLAEGRAAGLVEGRTAGLVEGRAAGLAEGLTAAVRSLLDARGLPVPKDLSDIVAGAPPDTVMAAALACVDADDLRRRLRDGRG